MSKNGSVWAGKKGSDVWTRGVGAFRTGLGSRPAMEFWTNGVWRTPSVRKGETWPRNLN